MRAALQTGQRHEIAYSLDAAWRLVQVGPLLKVEKRMGFLWCPATAHESPFSGMTLKSIVVHS
jgi:hypothetical protein